ncbi:MAG TPA: 3-deoxy-manno-octulosonate cytidylyltransferase [Nitrospiria bacterium]
MKVAIVIPARLKSTRLPAKMLVEINGKALISHVYERASKAPKVDRVLVATDSSEIFKHIKKEGGEVYMTSTKHPSGTDRIAEVVEREIRADVIVNVQGDLLMDSPKMIEDALSPFLSPQGNPVMTTLKKSIVSHEELNSPHVVKVVTDAKGRALYFSRSRIPFLRDTASGEEFPPNLYFKHYGLYAYQKDFLLTFVKLPLGKLEISEKLEQLRALENGYPIDVVETQTEGWEIDTQDDLERVRKLWCGKNFKTNVENQ